MASLNRVILLGNMTREPQLSYLPSQTAVVEFGMAMNRRYQKQDGSKGEEVCYVDCQMFGKRAETVNKYFKKGDPILVEGRLKFDSWQGQDGTKRSKLRVFVENFEFLGKGGQGGESMGGQQAPMNSYSHGGMDMAPPMDEVPYGTGMDDDIPF